MIVVWVCQDNDDGDNKLTFCSINRKLSIYQSTDSGQWFPCMYLFVLPPRSPKLNGHVERAQRAHTEGFHEVTEASFEIGEFNRALPE